MIDQKEGDARMSEVLEDFRVARIGIKVCLEGLKRGKPIPDVINDMIKMHDEIMGIVSDFRPTVPELLEAARTWKDWAEVVDVLNAICGALPKYLKATMKMSRLTELAAEVDRLAGNFDGTIATLEGVLKPKVCGDGVTPRAEWDRKVSDMKGSYINRPPTWVDFGEMEAEVPGPTERGMPYR